MCLSLCEPHSRIDRSSRRTSLLQNQSSVANVRLLLVAGEKLPVDVSRWIFCTAASPCVQPVGTVSAGTICTGNLSSGIARSGRQRYVEHQTSTGRVDTVGSGESSHRLVYVPVNRTRTGLLQNPGPFCRKRPVVGRWREALSGRQQAAILHRRKPASWIG